MKFFLQTWSTARSLCECQQRHKLKEDNQRVDFCDHPFNKVFSKQCSLRRHRECQFCENQEETPKHLLREYDQIYELFYSCITDDEKNPS